LVFQSAFITASFDAGIPSAANVALQYEIGVASQLCTGRVSWK
jgi:hypothetical protein